MRGSELERETELAPTHWRSRSPSIYGELLRSASRGLYDNPANTPALGMRRGRPVPAGCSTCSARLTAATQTPGPRARSLPGVTAGARRAPDTTRCVIRAFQESGLLSVHCCPFRLPLPRQQEQDRKAREVLPHARNYSRYLDVCYLIKKYILVGNIIIWLI